MTPAEAGRSRRRLIEDERRKCLQAIYRIQRASVQACDQRGKNGDDADMEGRRHMIKSPLGGERMVVCECSWEDV